MRLIIIVSILIVSTGFCKAQDWTLDDIEVYHSFDAFENVLKKKDNFTYIINFWATWCGPCVKELPYFEAMNRSYGDKHVKIILVSLDFEKQIESRLIPFLNKNEIRSEVVLLLDKKESSWIDRVDPEWSGALPITIVYNQENRVFYEKTFHSEHELEEILKPFLN